MILPSGYLILYLQLISLQQEYVLAFEHKSLKHFEILHADQVTYHSMSKRELKESDQSTNNINEQIHFSTLGQDFHVILTPKKDFLHPEFKAYSVDQTGKETIINLDHDQFYDGHIVGRTNSHASLHIDQGVMTGTIHLPDETYYFEPTWRHSSGADSRSMIAYKASDVELSLGQHAENPYGPPDSDYSTESSNDNYDHNERQRKRRQIDDENDYAPTETFCPLILVADYRFFVEMGGNSSITTSNYLISLIDRVHKIFYETVWKDNEETNEYETASGFKGMGFIIKRIHVHTEPTEVRGKEVHYNMIRDDWDIRQLLEVFSRDYAHKDYCLAHLFTDMKLEHGPGLAYVASPRRSSYGGICTQDEIFHNRHSMYLNSGLSSSRNEHGLRITLREADLITAHEMGHNWGAEHDSDDPECSPNTTHGGVYLMNAYYSSGYDANNYKFSPCSKRAIKKVLLAKSGRCFIKPAEDKSFSFCGNYRVEADEECDVGIERNDECCMDCKIRRNMGAVCSSVNSPCCENCQYMQKALRCREANNATCEEESFCTGSSAECPKSRKLPDWTVCEDNGICLGGMCVPYCEAIGFRSCMCEKVEYACTRCCFFDVLFFYEEQKCFAMDSDFLPDGTTCNQGQGYCSNGRCMKTEGNIPEDEDEVEPIEETGVGKGAGSNANKVLPFFRDNIVGCVMLVSMVIWIPASCIVNYVDHKRRKSY